MSTNNIIFNVIKSTYGNFITNLSYYHIDRSGDLLIHNWHDIALSSMQTLSPMDSSLTHTLKVFLSPHGQQRVRQIGPLLHVVSWPHGQQPHPHTIKETLPLMGSREEHIIQSERALT